MPGTTIFDGLPPLRQRLARVRPDVALGICYDHGLHLFLDKMPTFALGAAPEYRRGDEGWSIPTVPAFRGDPASSTTRTGPTGSPRPSWPNPDDTMKSLLQTWHDEHATFGRLLAVLEQQISGFHAGEEPGYELMLDIVDYLRHYADQFHHPREDAAFARLLRRSPDLRPQINRLLQEHRVIAAAGEDLLTRLREISVGAVLPRAAVETAAATYLIYYRHHIVTEERELLPRAELLLEAEDWAAVDSAVPGGSDPLHTARFAALRREIDSLSAPR